MNRPSAAWGLLAAFWRDGEPPKRPEQQKPSTLAPAAAITTGKRTFATIPTMPGAYNSQSAPGSPRLTLSWPGAGHLLPSPSQHPMVALTFHPHNPERTWRVLSSRDRGAIPPPSFTTPTTTAAQKRIPDRGGLLVILRALLPVLPNVYHLKGAMNFNQCSLSPLYFFPGMFLNYYYSPEVLALDLIRLKSVS